MSYENPYCWILFKMICKISRLQTVIWTDEFLLVLPSLQWYRYNHFIILSKPDPYISFKFIWGRFEFWIKCFNAFDTFLFYFFFRPKPTPWSAIIILMLHHLVSFVWSGCENGMFSSKSNLCYFWSFKQKQNEVGDTILTQYPVFLQERLAIWEHVYIMLFLSAFFLLVWNTIDWNKIFLKFCTGNSTLFAKKKKNRNKKRRTNNEIDKAIKAHALAYIFTFILERSPVVVIFIS